MDRVVTTIADGVADVRLARPEKLNAFDAAMFEAVAATIDRLADDPSVRCVVLSGEGRAFCVGIDLDLLAGGRIGDLLARRTGPANLYQYVAHGWRTLPQPVIAAVHGYAFGAGLQLALGADIRLCAADAQFAIMEARWGLIPDMAGIDLLRGLVRTDVARELAYTARRVDGHEAVRIGLATRVKDDPRTAALALARDIAANGSDATAAAKRLFNLAVDADTSTILMAESREQAILLKSRSHREAVATAAQAASPTAGTAPRS